ncbi:DUF4260 domain-containing protein [Phaeocystidibacter luteus]|uniref:DUF4260 domain-containing protein n=1 Tax=Phaeocystidibacter luteus TaxID=911197 RepID=A0A6N6RLU0_9FLAO|nr:DUF4260 domain-containing protein [Phaeocystidibacter luteus]KAB2814522.1 DUF4260 domain-containing protein [Phaeocystidibacter luteus]
MKTQLRLEELIQFVFAYLLTLRLGHDWWMFWAVILLPDIGMLGYLINTKMGAFFYNLFHHKGVALVVAAIGFYTLSDWTLFTGIILFGHSSMDRFMGYGLKYPDSFKHTHLGYIGKE